MKPNIKKFLSYYKPYLRFFYADMFCSLLLCATILAFPVCTRILTKHLQNDLTSSSSYFVYMLGAIMITLLVVHVFCRWFVDYYGHIMGALMEGDMRRDLFEHYQKLSVNFYDEQKTGQLLTRITSDSLNISELFHHGPEDFVLSILTFLGAFIIMFWINAKLALIVLILFPPMAIFTYFMNRKMTQSLRQCKDRIGDINAQVEDSLAGIRVVKSFTNDVLECEKFAVQNKRFIESRCHAYKNEAIFYGGIAAFTMLITIVVVILGGMRMIDGSLDFADLLAFTLFAGILVDPINRFSNFTHLYQEGISGFNRFVEALEVKPTILDKPDALIISSIQGHIEFIGVSFRYKEFQKEVLRNISLNIRAGEYVALVGASGVGKSTLCSLIPRFYEISAGKILLDGIDIRNIQQQSLRSHIGIVHQDVFLFAGTIIENISYGKPNASKEEIIEASINANAHDFIMSLPNGYDTDIGQRGVKLSGGQKQRLSIARAFLKNPPIIIFDEATSALDNESERALQKSMEHLSKNRTTIVIAHRLSTIRNAKRIIVLTEHGIVEQGSHSELVVLNGKYAQLNGSLLI